MQREIHACSIHVLEPVRMIPRRLDSMQPFPSWPSPDVCFRDTRAHLFCEYLEQWRNSVRNVLIQFETGMQRALKMRTLEREKGICTIRASIRVHPMVNSCVRYTRNRASNRTRPGIEPESSCATELRFPNPRLWILWQKRNCATVFRARRFSQNFSDIWENSELE